MTCTCIRSGCLGVTGRQRQRATTATTTGCRRDHRRSFPPAFQRGWVFGDKHPFARHRRSRLSLPRGSLGGGGETRFDLTWRRAARAHATQCDYCDYGIIAAAAASSAVPKSIISIVYRFFYSLRSSTVGEAARVSRVHTSPPPCAVRIR